MPPTNAKIEAICAYKVTGDTEMNEGRGPARIVGYFIDADDAKAASKGQAAMGTDGWVKAEQVVVVTYINELGEKVRHLLSEHVVHDHFDDPAVIRAQALAKLSPKERKILGL